MKSPLQQAIYNKIIRPEMTKITYDADGIIVGVNYYQQLVDIQWRESNSGAFRTAKDISIPRDGDGIYRQTPKLGDKVRIAFRNGEHAYPYISMIYNSAASKEGYQTKAGSGMPRGVGF